MTVMRRSRLFSPPSRKQRPTRPKTWLNPSTWQLRRMTSSYPPKTRKWWIAFKPLQIWGPGSKHVSDSCNGLQKNSKRATFHARLRITMSEYQISRRGRPGSGLWRYLLWTALQERIRGLAWTVAAFWWHTSKTGLARVLHNLTQPCVQSVQDDVASWALWCVLSLAGLQHWATVLLHWDFCLAVVSTWATTPGCLSRSCSC